MRIIQKRASELQRGDVVHFADLVDTVARVIQPDAGGVTVEVLVSRNGRMLWWHAGKDSMQNVEVQDEG